MSENTEINQGEIVFNYSNPKSGKLSFNDLGIEVKEISVAGGFLRLKIDLSNIGTHDYFAVPTIEVTYDRNCAETHWQCEFNGETILDKHDHFGHSTVILLNRDKLSSLEHRHINELIIHAEFPEEVNLVAENCYLNLFK